jgi:hypothetical protein
MPRSTRPLSQTLTGLQRPALRSALTLLPLLVALAGCPPVEGKDDTGGDSGGVDCTTEARASLQLSIVDQDGQAITGASGTYSGGGFTDEPCEGGFSEDNLLVCGWEVDGEIAVTVEAAGYGTESGTWTVTSDECHVETVQDSVTLVSITTD